EQLQHFLNLGALVDSSVTHLEHKGIITKLYDFCKRCLETEPGEEEPQVPFATQLCSVLPHMEIDDLQLPPHKLLKLKHLQIHHQSIQNPLPPTKRYPKRLQALPKTQAGRVLQGFQSSYSLRNPKGQGLIPQGGIPISAKDWTSTNGDQIQENENSTDNVPVTQENPDEQPLFRDEEQKESETQAPTEEGPIMSGSQQTLPA
ncbi:expressed protein, partial [Phakopsora pachyrhizi]